MSIYPEYVDALAFWQEHFKNKMAQGNSYKIYTLGCKVNQYDSRSLAGKLGAAGFSLVKKNADLAIINTCAVTKTAIQKGRRTINRARKENPKAKIAVMGCWPKVYEAHEHRKDGLIIVKDDREMDAVIAKFKVQNLKLSSFAEAMADKKATEDKKVQSSGENPELFLSHGSGGSLALNDKSRYFIKVQDGCEQYCSYCVIPYARGKLKSRGMDEILKEIGEATGSGYREIVLCGIHLGLYGKDFKNLSDIKAGKKCGISGSEGKINLGGLLKKIFKIKNLGRIRLSSIEITEVSGELIGLMAEDKKMCKHLHIPLQSGSDKILKLMNRPYDREFFRERVEKIRKAAPDVALTTDVIIGFPGETGADFMDTYNFIKEMKFSRLHVFPFSAHEKTPAAKMPGAVSDEIKRERVKKLKALGDRLSREYEKRFIGRGLIVVVSGKKSGDKLIGKSEHYFDVCFHKSRIMGGAADQGNENSRAARGKNLVGRLVKVKFTKEESRE
ncbi:MAG: tRNA (N(6)-L-threonylcarbamoyladenosine(37)-C(2))-methylthiotransferase MtaB [Patescibacteria group bacterium]